MNQPLIDTTLLQQAEAPWAIECRSLTVSYGNRARLRDVSVVFRPRAVTALLGPSGCGKTTLLRTLNRTLELIPGARIRSGAVIVEGVDAYRPGSVASDIRARVGMLQQKPAPFPMSILDNVLFGARYHGLISHPIEDARRYLKMVGLWDEVKTRLTASALTLSGGQQQRLCLARTLAVHPAVLLMDEPCSALDPRATAVIERMVRELAQQYTIVIVTHNIAQARRVADHCAFMLDGEVLAAGTRDEILTHPVDPTVRDFVTGTIG